MGRRKELVTGSPGNVAKARDFLDWFAAERDKIKFYIRNYDDDLLSEAMLRVYDTIVRRGTSLNDYLGYYLKTYRSVLMDTQRSQGYDVPVDDVRDLQAPDFDADKYEAAVEAINTEVLDYVRANYDEVAVSLFEIYVGLSPDISYKRMSAMLGIPATRIWPVIGQIKKDLVKRFGQRHYFMLSVVDF